MRSIELVTRTVSFAAILSACQAQATPVPQAPVVGGPCEGCELVFVGLKKRAAALRFEAEIAGSREPGARMTIEGTVRRPDGAAATGVIVYAYQTDNGGVYPSAETRHGRLRAWARTDKDGYYRFETIYPGGYPDRDIPRHVHMHIIEPGRATYYVDDLMFTDDPRLTPAMRKRYSNGRGGLGIVTPTRDARGLRRVRRDITLGLNIPDYPKSGAVHAP